MRLRPILLRTILLLTLAVAGAHFKGAAALAQEPQAPASAQAPLADTPLDQATKEIDKAKVQLTALQDGVKQNADNDDALVGLATKADELSRAVITISVNLRPRFDQIKNRLAEIGDPPKDGQPPEAEIVTQERNALAAERAQINALTGDAENLSITVTKLVNEITEMRRRLFADTLLRRTEISV
ncbi:mechanosensitive ion channel family protein, partial [Rhizobium leguminosarum bv. viciae]